jgi:uncharacterized membrane protein YqjE
VTPLGREEWGRAERFRRDVAGDLRERPLADLLRELVQEAQGLLREEVRLAKAELREEAQKAAKGGSAIGAGGALLYAALLFLGGTLVLLGATFLTAWVAALIVTGIYGAAGWAVLSYGRQELQKSRPARAVEHVKEDAQWAKETMRDIRSSRSANA